MEVVIDRSGGRASTLLEFEWDLPRGKVSKRLNIRSIKAGNPPEPVPAQRTEKLRYLVVKIKKRADLKMLTVTFLRLYELLWFWNRTGFLSTTTIGPNRRLYRTLEAALLGERGL